jgi:GGDEF domain-containing protein
VRLSARPHRQIWTLASVVALVSLALLVGMTTPAYWLALAFAGATFALLQDVKRLNADAASLLSSFNRSVANSNGTLNFANSIKMLEVQMGAIGQRLSETAGRYPQRHPVTKLPTREPLLAAMAAQSASASAPSLLGVIELLDFDRLCAFDQEGADQLLKCLAERLVRMTDPSRIIAQIDRSCFAILFVDVFVEAARVELETLSYALRDRFDGHDQGMQPQIRSAGIVACQADDDATETLARAVATLSASRETGIVLVDPRETARQTFRLEQQLSSVVQFSAKVGFENSLVGGPFISFCRG